MSGLFLKLLNMSISASVLIEMCIRDRLVKVLVEVNDEKELREYQADQLKFKPKRRRDVKLTAEEMKELAALEDRGGKSKIDDTK